MTKYLVSGPDPAHHLPQEILTAAPPCRLGSPVRCVFPAEVQDSQGGAVGDQNIRVGGDFVPDTPQLPASGEIEGGIGEPRLPGAPVELDAHQMEGLVL